MCSDIEIRQGPTIPRSVVFQANKVDQQFWLNAQLGKCIMATLRSTEIVFHIFAFVEVQKQGWEWHSKTLWRKGYGKTHCAWSTLECKVGSFQNSVGKLFLRLDHDNLQDKPYWYKVPLGPWYDQQAQGRSTNWNKYEGDMSHMGQKDVLT